MLFQIISAISGAANANKSSTVALTCETQLTTKSQSDVRFHS